MPMEHVVRTLVGLSAAVSVSVAQPIDAGRFLELDGVDDLVAAPGDFFSESLTIEAWVRPRTVHPDFTAGVVAYGSRDLSSFDFGIGPVGDTRLRFFVNYNQGQRTAFGTQPIQLDRWQHLAVTYDGQTARMYIDGELDAEVALGTPILPSGPDAVLAIGDDYPGASEFVGGSFDEVRIWSVIRTQSEIASAMMTPLRGDEPGLLAYYDFDECGSQVVVDGAGSRHGALGIDLSAGADDPVRERYAPSRQRCLTISSSSDGVEVRPIVGLLEEQINQVNAGPPALGWGPVVNRHADLHTRGGFACDPDLGLPYVDSERYLVGADEVTLDNCGSAFYRVRFTLPGSVSGGEVFGAVNADDLGVVYLNGVAVSPRLTVDDAANVGTDRIEGRKRLVGWPSVDPVFEDEIEGLAVAGVNELAVAVCSDASDLEPAGVEFEFAVAYDCLADWNGDGEIDTQDYAAFLNAWAAREPEADLNRDGRVNSLDMLAWLNVWNFGCPE